MRTAHRVVLQLHFRFEAIGVRDHCPDGAPRRPDRENQSGGFSLSVTFSQFQAQFQSVSVSVSVSAKVLKEGSDTPWARPGEFDIGCGAHVSHCIITALFASHVRSLALHAGIFQAPSGTTGGQVCKTVAPPGGTPCTGNCKSQPGLTCTGKYRNLGCDTHPSHCCRVNDEGYPNGWCGLDTLSGSVSGWGFCDPNCKDMPGFNGNPGAIYKALHCAQLTCMARERFHPRPPNLSEWSF